MQTTIAHIVRRKSEASTALFYRIEFQESLKWRSVALKIKIAFCCHRATLTTLSMLCFSLVHCSHRKNQQRRKPKLLCVLLTSQRLRNINDSISSSGDIRQQYKLNENLKINHIENDNKVEKVIWMKRKCEILKRWERIHYFFPLIHFPLDGGEKK